MIINSDDKIVEQIIDVFESSMLNFESQNANHNDLDDLLDSRLRLGNINGFFLGVLTTIQSIGLPNEIEKNICDQIFASLKHNIIEYELDSCLSEELYNKNI